MTAGTFSDRYGHKGGMGEQTDSRKKSNESFGMGALRSCVVDVTSLG